MANFPSLKPAMKATILMERPIVVGQTGSGSELNVVNIVGGHVKAEPGFSPNFNATLISGNNFVHGDPGKKQIRIDARTLLKDDSTGAHLAFHYSGAIATSSTFNSIVYAEDPQTIKNTAATPMGQVHITVSFETPEGPLRELEHAQFVGVGKFVGEPGKKEVRVEYLISQVVA